MSEQLISSVPRDVLAHLARLDDECQNMPPGKELNIYRGPFGAFKASHDLPSSSSGSIADGSSPGVPVLPPVEGQDELFTTLHVQDNFPFSPSDLLNFITMDDTSNLDLLQGFSDITALSLDELPESHSFTDTFLSRASQIPSNQRQPPDEPNPSTSVRTTHQSPKDHISLMRSPSTDVAINQGVLFLIQHFSTTVLTYLTPIRHERTPWEILFLPHMRNTLALLTLGQTINHADTCIFQGLLAISALSIGGAHESQTWLEQGIVHRQRAYHACGLMLQACYDVPKRYKYKSVLMALQVAVLISTLGGDPLTEEFYFLETEKFIKLKGLGRKRSRKVRMLHRCYAFERLLYESTCMRGIDFKHRRRVRNDIKSVSVVPYPDDGMAFRLPDWQSLDEQISKPRSLDDDGQAASLEDEVLGLWPDALCAKVAGIPEHWIVLLLHVVLLGKQKDAVEQEGSSDTEHLQEFLKRAKTLESCINQHVLQPDLPSLPDKHTTIGDGQISSWESVLDAIRHSLQIYFYRRIYEVEALWLQDKVVKVRDCLLRIEVGDSMCSELSGCVAVLWASFIASCEAEDAEVQKSFARWYRRAARRTGMSTWMNSLTLSENLWAEKRRSRGRKVTWIDILKKHQRRTLQPCVIVV